MRGSQVVRHLINGEVVLEYSNPQLDNGKLLESGTISLQSESHPVQFRKVELLNLEGCMDSDSAAYRDYFVKSNPGPSSVISMSIAVSLRRNVTLAIRSLNSGSSKRRSISAASAPSSSRALFSS